MCKFSLISAVCVLFLSFSLKGQTITSTLTGGPWNDVNTWEDGVIPDPSGLGNYTSIVVAGPVSIPNGASIDADRITVNSVLTVESGGTLNLLNDLSGTDLIVAGGGSLNVSGILIYNNLATIAGTTALNTNILSGGVFRNMWSNGGSLPLATWDVNSTLEVRGVTSGMIAPTNTTWLQTFGNVLIDCPGITGSFIMNGMVRDVAGNLSITNTNARLLFLTPPTGSATIHVGGNMTVSGNSNVYFNNSGLGTIYNIAGDLNYNSTYSFTTTSFFNNTGTNTINIGGDLNANFSGHQWIWSGSSGTALSTINLSGDFNFSSGNIATVNGRAQLNFIGSTSHTVDRTGGSFINLIDFNIPAGETVLLGTSVLDGQGTFTLGGTLSVGSTHADGAIQNYAPTPAGNIRTQGGRTFSPGATIVYAGGPLQYIGNGHPQTGGINLTVNNGGTVQYASGLTGFTVTGNLTLTSGNLEVDLLGLTVTGDLTMINGNLNVAANRKLTLNGNLVSNGNTISMTSSSDLEILGSGAFGTFPFPGSQSINSLVLNRAGASVSIPGDLTIQSQITLTEGTLDISSQKFTLLGSSFSATNGSFSGNSASIIRFSGSGDLGPLRFSGGGNALKSLHIDRGIGAAINLVSQLSIADSLVLTSGWLQNTVGINLGNGATLLRNSDGELLNNGITVVGTDNYNLTYSGGSISPGLELPLPASTSQLNNLLIQDPVLLEQDLTINGDVTLEGDLQCTSGTITMNGGIWQSSGGLFLPGTSIVEFPSTTSLVSSGSPLYFGDIHVLGTGDVQLPVGILDVSGNFNVESGGSVTHNNGTLNLSGSVDMNLGMDGNFLNNVSVNKINSRVLLTSPLNLVGSLDLFDNSEFDSNDNLILLSTSDGLSGNARIGPLLNGAIVTGGVTFQRFMSGEGRIYRYISSPINGATVEDLMDNFPVTGTFDDPSTNVEWPGLSRPMAEANPSFFEYDETLVGANLVGWTAYPVTGSASENLLLSGKGYAAFIREDVASTTWDLTGEINQGTIDLGAGYTDTGSPADDGWNLVGNPYPSSIDWDADDWIKTDVANIIYIVDNSSGTLVARIWDPDMGTGTLTSGVIAAGQAFWVRATTASTLLSVGEEAKTQSTGEFFRQSTESDRIEIRLAKNGLYEDAAFFRLREGASMSLDQWDGPKMLNSHYSLSILDADNKKMMISATSEIPCDGLIALDLYFPKKEDGSLAVDPTGEYTFNLSSVGALSQRDVVLVDRYSNSTNAITDGTVSYSFAISNNAGSYAANRFYLTIDSTVEFVAMNAPVQSICGENETVNLVLANSQPYVRYSVEVNGNPTGSFMGTGEHLEVNVGELLQEGRNDIVLKVLNSCGDDYEISNAVSIQKAKQYSVLSTTSSSVCLGGEVTLTATGSGLPDNAKYRWYEAENSTSILQESESDEFVTPFLSKERSYFVSIINENGCEGPRTEVLAEVVIFEPAEISTEGNYLTSNFEEGNTWYLNNEIVSNEQSFLADQSGSYQLEVSFRNCISEDNFDFVITDLENGPASLKVFPNPILDELNLVGVAEVDRNQISIWSLEGRRIDLPYADSIESIRFDFSGVPSGVYAVRIRYDNGKQIVRRVVKY